MALQAQTTAQNSQTSALPCTDSPSLAPRPQAAGSQAHSESRRGSSLLWPASSLSALHIPSSPSLPSNFRRSSAELPASASPSASAAQYTDSRETATAAGLCASVSGPDSTEERTSSLEFHELQEQTLRRGDGCSGGEEDERVAWEVGGDIVVNVVPTLLVAISISLSLPSCIPRLPTLL